MGRLLIISLNGDPLAELGSIHAGGQCKYILQLTRRLVRFGWKIDIFTIQNPGSTSTELITYDVSVVRFPLADASPYEGTLNDNQICELRQAMLKWIEEAGFCYTSILACYWLSALAALQMRSQLGTKVIVSFCSLGFLKQLACPALPLNRRIATEKWIASQADAVIATSQEEARILGSAYQADPKRVTVIPRGVDIDVFKPNI